MIECFPLNDFDGKSWEQTELAFARMQPLQFRQAWRPQPEAGFEPAQVRLGWRAESLFALATFQDEDIFTRATGDSQELWELGDVLEIFLRVLPGVAWYELHVSPYNHQLELHWPDDPETSARDGLGLQAHLAAKKIISSRTRICREKQQWQTLVQISAPQVTGGQNIHAGQQWLISFCRYDYWRDGRPPVLSSTSPLQSAAFWNQEEWRNLTFVK